MKRIFQRLSGVIVMLGLVITSGAVSTGCFCFMHQPELPNGAKELKKKK